MDDAPNIEELVKKAVEEGSRDASLWFKVASILGSFCCILVVYYLSDIKVSIKEQRVELDKVREVTVQLRERAVALERIVFKE